MALVGRNFAVGNDYRYGFNGKENDDETYGNNNAIHFGERIYNSRLGLWMSKDPHERMYPSISPYSFANNSPIMCIDQDGRDVYIVIERNPNGGGKITLSSTIYVTGLSAETSAAEFNKEFEKWASYRNNVGFYTTKENGKEVVWEIEIQMTFVPATAEDVIRITNAGQGAASENLVESQFNYPYNPFVGPVPAYTTSLPGEPYEMYEQVGIYRTPKWQWGYRYTKISILTPAYVIIHEILHTYGLSDRYSNVKYEYKASDGSTQTTKTSSKPHTGFENDFMGGGKEGEGVNAETPLIGRHYTNVGSYILQVSKELGDKFVLSRLSIDDNDPSNVPETYIECFEDDECIEYSNPTE